MASIFTTFEISISKNVITDKHGAHTTMSNMSRRLAVGAPEAIRLCRPAWVELEINIFPSQKFYYTHIIIAL